MPNKKPNLKAGAKATPDDSESFCTPDKTKSQVVLVNDELKLLANEYLEAFHQVNLEVVDQDLPKLCARFLRTEDATAALEHAREFAAYVFKKGAAKLKLPVKSTSENLPLPGRMLLPEIFSWPADDITASRKDHEIKRGCDVDAAKLYLAIFAGNHFKRLVANPDGGMVDKARKELLANVQHAQECLVAYLQAMVKQAHPHIVEIQKDLTVKVDGEVLEKQSAGKRALLTLALLRNRPSFTTAEFSKVFYGDRTPGDFAAEFSTAIRDAKRIVPGLKPPSDHRGNRTVSGIFFVVYASDQELKQAIAGMLSKAKR